MQLEPDCLEHWTLNILGKTILSASVTALRTSYHVYWPRCTGAAWLMTCTDWGVQVPPGSWYVLTKLCRCSLAHNMYWLSGAGASWLTACTVRGAGTTWLMTCTEGCRCLLAHDAYWWRDAGAAWLTTCTDWVVQVPPGSWHVLWGLQVQPDSWHVLRGAGAS